MSVRVAHHMQMTGTSCTVRRLNGAVDIIFSEIAHDMQMPIHRSSIRELQGIPSSREPLKHSHVTILSSSRQHPRTCNGCRIFRNSRITPTWPLYAAPSNL